MSDTDKSQKQLTGKSCVLRSHSSGFRNAWAQGRTADSEGDICYEKIFDAIQDGVNVIDTELNVLRVNRTVQNRYASDMPLVGEKCYRVFQQRQSPCTWCPCLPAIASGRPHTQIVPYPSETNPLGWLELSAFPVMDGTGAVTAVIEYSKDITDRKKAEEALEKSEERYRRTSENIPVMVYSALPDEDSTTVFICGNAEELTGYSVDDFLQRKRLWPSIVYPEDRARVLKRLKDSLRSRTTFVAEYRIATRDGGTRWVRDKARPALDETGGIVRIDGFVEDITERRLVAEALRKSEERYRLLFEASHDGIASVDSEGRFIEANRAYCTMVGYSPDELRELEDFYAITPERWRGWEREEMWNRRLLRKGFTDVYEKEYIRKDGTVFPVELQAFAAFDRDGEPDYIWAVVRDITERRRLDESIQQSRKMEAIGTLAGGIAHDFNNILGVIVGYLELAQDDTPATSPVRQYLDEMLKSASRAKDLVRQILSFSRKNRDGKRPVLIPQIVTEAAGLLRSTLPALIEIRQHIDEQAGMVYADPTRIHQIVMNLCTNAAYAMQEHGGVLEIGVRPVSLTEEHENRFHGLAPGPYIELVISDTGCGIDAAILPRIFEPFFTTKEKHKGTGMGLAVVHGIVKDCGGDITVESRIGKGTTCTVVLPLAAANHEMQERMPAAVPGGTECILFVDDEKNLTDIATRGLQSLGYTVVACNSAREALEAFERSPDTFDLVITDQTMPHMTGYDLTKRLLARRPDLPVILSSGYSETMTTEKAKAAGIKKFVFKPVSKQELAQTIREVLDSNGT